MDTKKSIFNKPYICEYCETGYAKEKTLMVHMCEQKRRHLQKGEKRVQLGYQAFVKFYQKSAGQKNIKTYEEFCKSSFYNAFVKFGSFLNNVRPLYTEKYMDYIVTSGIKIDHWCNETIYEKYAIELIMKEDVETALERSVSTMAEWAATHESQWNHYFFYVSLNKATFDIKDGKISPWLILNCKSGKEMLAKLNDEQLNMIYQILNPEHWALRFKRHPKDVELVKQIAKEGNL
jgi:hypothetical protein